MWNPPTTQDLSRLPGLYETEPCDLKDKTIYMHFFIGGCDWYITEYDADNRLFFGYAILHQDHLNAEWGYILFDEMLELRTTGGIEVDRDLYWYPVFADEVANICQGMGWPKPERS